MKNLNRRTFLQQVAFAAGTASVAATIPSFLSPPKMHEGKKINIALCGLGRYAGYLAEGLQETQYCKLAGIVTGTAAKAIEWKNKYNIPDKNIYTYKTFNDIINNPDIDLVYVVLPNAMHKEFTIRAAKAGKHVIVEKPMAITESDCKEMIAACKNADPKYKAHSPCRRLPFEELDHRRDHESRRKPNPAWADPRVTRLLPNQSGTLRHSRR